MEKIIAMVADNKYLQQLSTTIKSICMNNDSLKFYILNDDIAPEWFRMTNKYLKQLDSEIIDVKIFSQEIKNYQRQEHIGYAAYFRYFIPKYIKEEKVLYLDSDLIITNNLDSLFNIDLEENYLAAVKDIGEYGNFNSGVMLINTKKWLEDNITERLVDTTNSNNGNIKNGDQSIFNLVIGDKYFMLNKNFNYQIGYDYLLNTNSHFLTYEELGDYVPTIIHFLTNDKPWNTYSSSRFRDLWWYYYELDWQTIISSYKTKISNKYKNKVFILTTSESIHQLEILVEKLPDTLFEIAAYTWMGDNLLKFGRYENIRLYPLVEKNKVEKLLSSCDYFLDIHYGEETDNILLRAKEKGKKIIAFDVTVHNKELVGEENIISGEEPEKLISIIAGNGGI